MSCSLYAWLGERSPKISNESLAFDLTCCLVDEDGAALQVASLPTDREPRLTLRWGDWTVRLGYEEGAAVAGEFANQPDSVRDALAGGDCLRRIRFDFDARSTVLHATKQRRLTTFLQDIYGAVVADVQPRELA